ncbi:MAG: hypothetical protein ABF868_06810 [Sporolactobacillus sp.]
MPYVIIAALAMAAIQIFTHILSGDKQNMAHQDERQRKIFRDAAIFSWQTLLLYGVMHLVVFYFNLTRPGGTFIDTPFFQHGGDILFIAVIGYLLGLVMSYFSATKLHVK